MLFTRRNNNDATPIMTPVAGLTHHLNLTLCFSSTPLCVCVDDVLQWSFALVCLLCCEESVWLQPPLQHHQHH